MEFFLTDRFQSVLQRKIADEDTDLVLLALYIDPPPALSPEIPATSQVGMTRMLHTFQAARILAWFLSCDVQLESAFDISHGSCLATSYSNPLLISRMARSSSLARVKVLALIHA
jgi:hypothetical protein